MNTQHPTPYQAPDTATAPERIYTKAEMLLEKPKGDFLVRDDAGDVFSAFACHGCQSCFELSELDELIVHYPHFYRLDRQ